MISCFAYASWKDQLIDAAVGLIRPGMMWHLFFKRLNYYFPPRKAFPPLSLIFFSAFIPSYNFLLIWANFRLLQPWILSTNNILFLFLFWEKTRTFIESCFRYLRNALCKLLPATKNKGFKVATRMLKCILGVPLMNSLKPCERKVYSTYCFLFYAKLLENSKLVLFWWMERLGGQY